MTGGKEREMGYSYGRNEKGNYVLSCDSCGNIGGVLKRKCPHNYCPAPALCPSCWIERRGELKAYHETHCKAASERYAAQRQREKDLMENGEFIRCAALSHDDRVKVIFRGKSAEKAFFMSHETYDSIPLGETALVSNYEKFGPCVEAKSIDIYANI